MWSKPTASYDYTKPLLCSLALHAVLAVLFYLSPHPTTPNITTPLTVTLVHQQTFKPHKQAAAAPSRPKVVIPTKARPTVTTTVSHSSPTNHQARIETSINTQTENTHNLTSDTTKNLDTATLEQDKTDTSKTGNPSVINTIEEPIFDAAYLQNREPIYPSFARRLQQQGIVKLRVKVSEQGLAEIIELAESSGFKLLDESAQKTVKSWRFVPAKRGAEAISAWVIVPIHFQLS